MKIDEQESCEYRFALICIGFDRFYRFLLFDFTFSGKRKKTIKGKEFKNYKKEEYTCLKNCIYYRLDNNHSHILKRQLKSYICSTAYYSLVNSELRLLHF